jgi:hypothetical protein
VQGTLVTFLALTLLFFPAAMVTAWPWEITPLLAQIYSAPFLSYGVGSLLLSQQKTRAEVSIAVRAMLVFTAGVLLASLIHRNLFSTAEVATWLWFGGFLVSTFVLGLLSVPSITWTKRDRHE